MLTQTRHLTRTGLAVLLPLAAAGALLTAPGTAVASATSSPAVAVTEVAPWGSGTTGYGADWWELTNFGTTALNISGWKMDDDSDAIGSAVALNGVTVLAPGESAIFTETTTVPNAVNLLRNAYSIPATVQIGSYSGGGVGLSTSGDQVNIFDASGTHIAGVTFGASTTNKSFDNAAGIDGTISTLSQAGVNGASLVTSSTSPSATISPGTIGTTSVRITEVAPWGSSESYAADWFELTNESGYPVTVNGWTTDDNSDSFAGSDALQGVTNIAGHESVIFAQGGTTGAAGFRAFWSLPSSVQVGYYSGSSGGLGQTGDHVNVFDAGGNVLAAVQFGVSTNRVSFDNAVAANGAISTLSVNGTNGATTVGGETASPGVAPVITGTTTTGTPTPTPTPTSAAPTGNLPWPGPAQIDTVDTQNFVPQTQGNLSGLAYVPSGTSATGQMWAIDNGGPAELFKLAYDGTNWTNAGGSWAAPKAVHYPDGSGEPDSEGVTVGGDGGIYVSTERDNDNGSVSKPSILRFDPNATGSSINATAEWDVGPAMQQGIGANLGLEAISYIPDSYLVANGLYDSSTGQPYNPATYPNHGSGLYFGGLEANGVVYGFALDQGGTTYHLVTQFTSGFNQVVDSDFDSERGLLWEHCDNGCGDATTTLAISSSTHTFAVTAKYDPPAQLPTTQNDEGFAIAPDAECVNALKPVYFADDTDDDGHSLRRGFITCGALPTAALPEFPLLALPVLSAFALLAGTVWVRRRTQRGLVSA